MGERTDRSGKGGEERIAGQRRRDEQESTTEKPSERGKD